MVAATGVAGADTAPPSALLNQLVVSAPSNAAMAAALKEALAKVVADGTYAQLIGKWQLPASVSIFK